MQALENRVQEARAEVAPGQSRGGQEARRAEAERDRGGEGTPQEIISVQADSVRDGRGKAKRRLIL